MKSEISGTRTGLPAVYSPSQLDAAGDVDPVAEADVYLAYGRDLQAEQILLEALRNNPERGAVREKLREIRSRREQMLSPDTLAVRETQDPFRIRADEKEDASTSFHFSDAAPSPVNPPVLPVSGEEQIQYGAGFVQEQTRTVQILYATNRLHDPSDHAYYSGERGQNLTFGAALVRVPEAHRMGKLELPFKLKLFSVTVWEADTDPQEHFEIKEVKQLARESWTEVVRRSGSSHALVFLHGFNTSYRDGLLRASQIFWDLQYSGVPVYFSWPSRGTIASYLYDRDSALGARRQFIDLLRTLRSAGVSSIHVLAHSMGNLVALDGLAHHQHAMEPLNVAEFLMAAPDIDRNHYLDIAPLVSAAVRGMTLYASSEDKALALSKSLAGDVPRAGDVPSEGPVVVPGIDSIDVTAIGKEIFGLGHGHFAQERPVLNDIALVLSHSLRPPNSRLREIRGMPEKAIPFKWWRFSP